MCTQISIVFPRGASCGLLSRVASAYHLGYLEPLSDAALEAQLPERSQVAYLPGCQCGTALAYARIGSESHDATPPETDAERKRAAGWSDAKVDRWLEERRRAAARDARRAHNRELSAPLGDAEAWVNFIREALRRGAASWLGVLVTDGRPHRVRATLTLDAHALTPEQLVTLEPAVLYVVR